MSDQDNYAGVGSDALTDLFQMTRSPAYHRADLVDHGTTLDCSRCGLTVVNLDNRTDRPTVIPLPDNRRTTR